MVARRVVIWSLMGLFLLSGCASEPLQPLPTGPTGGWTLFRPHPTGTYLNDVWADSPANIWAVGAAGTIIHWNGERVLQVDSPTTNSIRSVDGWAADNLYAAAGNQILHYDGRTWEIVAENNEGYASKVYCAADGKIYLLGWDGLSVFDEGESRNIPGSFLSPSAIWEGPDGRIRVGDFEKLWVIEDETARVEQVFPGLSINLGDGWYLVGEDTAGNDIIYQFTGDPGWSPTGSVGASIRAILDFSSSLIADNAGLQLGGSQVWLNDSGRWIYGLKRVNSSGFVACGSSGTLLHAARSVDGFEIQENYEGLGFGQVNDLDGSSCDDIWLAEWYGRVLHFDGTDWSRENAILPYGSVNLIQTFAEGWVVAASGTQISLRDPETGSWSYVPEADHLIWRVHPFAPDSIMVSTNYGYEFWNGESWTPAGTLTGNGFGFAQPPSGSLFSLEGGENTLLKSWDGQAFQLVLEIPGFSGKTIAPARETESLWIGGKSTTGDQETQIYHFVDGAVHLVSQGVELPEYVVALEELETDDLFVLTFEQLWRFRDGHWSRELGLPSEGSFKRIWSHPGCGVYVQGSSLYFKDYGKE